MATRAPSWICRQTRAAVDVYEQLKKSIGAAIYLDLSTEAPSSHSRLHLAIAASIAMLNSSARHLVVCREPNATRRCAEHRLDPRDGDARLRAQGPNQRAASRVVSRIPTWLYDRRQVGHDGDVMVTAQESTSLLTLDALDERDQRWFQGYQRFNLQADVIAYERKTIEADGCAADALTSPGSPRSCASLLARGGLI